MASPTDFFIPGKAKGEDLRVENGTFYQVSTGQAVDVRRYFAPGELGGNSPAVTVDYFIRGSDRWVASVWQAVLDGRYVSEKTFQEFCECLSVEELRAIIKGMELVLKTLEDELAARKQVKKDDKTLCKEADKDIEAEDTSEIDELKLEQIRQPDAEIARLRVALPPDIRDRENQDTPEKRTREEEDGDEDEEERRKRARVE